MVVSEEESYTSPWRFEEDLHMLLSGVVRRALLKCTHLSLGDSPQCLNELQPRLGALCLADVFEPLIRLLYDSLDGCLQLAMLLAQ